VDNKEDCQLQKAGPGFFYGYIVVVVSFLILIMTLGLFMVFGVFFKPLQDEFGWSSALTSGAFSIAFSISVIVQGSLSILMGGLTDRLGPRLVVTLCGLLLGLGYLLMSQINAAWQLYLFFGVIIGIGMSGVWIPPLSTIARWFVRRRGMMTGIAVAGAAVGTLIGSPISSRLINTYGWRLSYVILGGALLVIVILTAQFLRRDPTQVGQFPYGGKNAKEPELEPETKSFSFQEAVRTIQFWLFIFMFFCFGFCMDGAMVHIVPHAIELGIPSITAANMLAISFGISIIGNFTLGSLGDRIGSRQIFIIGFILMAAALFCLMLARDLWLLYLFALVFGIAFGGLGTSESPLVAWLFGLSSHGLIFGFALLGFNCGAAAGPFVTGYIFDITGSYRYEFLVSACVGIIGLILSSTLKPPQKLGGRI